MALVNLAEMLARKSRTAKRQLGLVPPKPAQAPLDPAEFPPLPQPGQTSAPMGRREQQTANRQAMLPASPGVLASQYKAGAGTSATGEPYSGVAGRRLSAAGAPAEAEPQSFESLQQQRDAVMAERMSWSLRHPILSGGPVAQRMLKPAEDWYAGREKPGEGVAQTYGKLGLDAPEGGFAGRRFTEPGVYDPLRQAMDDERTRLRKRQMMVDRMAILNAADIGKRLPASVRYRILTEDRPDPDLMIEVPKSYQYVNREGIIMQRDPVTGIEKRVGTAPLDPNLNQPASISGREGWTDGKGQFHQFRNPVKSADEKAAEQSAKDLESWENEYRKLEAQASIAMPKLDAQLVDVAAKLKALGFTKSASPEEQAKLQAIPGIATLVAQMKSLIRQRQAWQTRMSEAASRRPGGPVPGRPITTGQPVSALEPGVTGGETTNYGQVPGGAANYPSGQTGAQPPQVGEGEMAAPEVELVTEDDVVNYAISLAQAGMTPEQAYQDLLDMAVEGEAPDPDGLVQRIMAQVIDQFETQ